MSGKEMAQKLRDFGFSEAKSHMSALDEFQLIQAEALLQVNGHSPNSATSDADGGTPGGLIVRKKKKKKKTDEAVAAAPVQEAPDQRSVPPIVETEAAHEEPALPVDEPEIVASVEGPAEVAAETPPVVDGAPPAEPVVAVPAAPAESVEPAAQAPAAQVRAAQAPTPELAEATASAPASDQAAASADLEPVASAAEATEGTIETAGETPRIEEADQAPAVQEQASSDAAAPEGAGSTQGAEAAAKAKTEGEAAAPGAPAAEAEGGKASAKKKASEGSEDEAKTPEKTKPKGNVVGFIDPTSFQRASPTKRKPESRRLQSRDDSMPDVRPTFGRDRNAGRNTGARGSLTAGQLREREQGRFLRRARPAGGHGGGRRGRGGYSSRDKVTESPMQGQAVQIETPVTMSKFAEALKLKSGVIQGTALSKGYGMFTVNSILDDDTVALLASEFGVEVDIKHEITAEQAHLEEVKRKRSEIDDEELIDRAPIVAFLGHVDHGKTSLIDKIRETKVADHESGGITQHIGAYQIETTNGQLVTILDTPGHAAFTAMRARGAQAVDVVVLVVAGDDGVKPSTEEAVAHARAAGAPIIVAVNKKDKTGYNFNSSVQQLMGLELTPEQYGGTTPMFETSAMTGDGIKELLDHLVLMGEAELELKAHPKGRASGVVLEAEIQQGMGIVAHLLVQDGTLSRGDVILAGEGYGKVKSIQNDVSKQLQEAGPSMPIEVTGLAALPGVGNAFYVVENLAKAKEIAVERERTNRAMAMAAKREPSKDLAAILGSAPKTERKMINLIVRCDVQGSVQVIRHEVEKLQHDEVEVKLVHSGVGPITESDVDLAATSDALLVAFHVGVNGKARTEADRHGLDIRRYEVIYELLDDLRDLMEGSLAPEFQEEITGHVEIRRIFKSSRIGLIAGCFVLDGSVRRSSKVRLLRDEQVVYTGGLASLRREKDEAKEVREGFECGIVLKDYRDIREGDIIETFRMKEIKRTLAGS
ncbi:MAG: translation initiation factor IF-2 [bacterium]|nr:translation initiation factor IF-2 [bacterium]